MSGLVWLVVVVAIVASALLFCAGVVIVIAFLFGTSSRLFANDSDR
jgi:hypothetical protein